MWLGIDLDPALLLRGGEDDERSRLAHPADRVQLLDEELAERGHVLDPDLEQKRELAGDMVAFEDLVEVADRLDETGLEFGMFDEYLDERRDVLAQLPLVQERDIAADDAAALELPDPLVDGGRGETDRLGQLRLRDLGVVLKQRQKLAVDLVENGTVLMFR